MTRLVSGLVMAALVVVAIWFLPAWWLRTLVFAVACVAHREFMSLAAGLGARVSTLVAGLLMAIVFAVAVAPAASIGEATPFLGLALVVAGGLALAQPSGPATLVDFGALLGGAIYIGVPLGQLAALHASSGRWIVLLVLATVVVSDSAQYYAGRMFGRTPLAPAVSPKKTVEGAVGGLVGGVVLMTTMGRWVLPAYPLWVLAPLGAALVAVGIVGDLFESKLKRAAHIKDSSHLIPGHGGVLDRIDALLFVTPVFYAFFVFTMARFHR